jgi:hypothetical protein
LQQIRWRFLPCVFRNSPQVLNCLANF